MNKSFIKKLQQAGLTRDDIIHLKKMDRESAIQWIAQFQEKQRSDLSQNNVSEEFIPEIGKDIAWLDIVEIAFRVLDFDRNGTIYSPDGDPEEIKAKSATEPYGYLLIESPALNQPVGLPIIHHDDFMLASTVFDDPNLVQTINSPSMELLVTYAPKYMTKDGYSKSPDHVLHYAITPRGTLEQYYSEDSIGDKRVRKPESHLLFGKFIYKDQIQVQMNLEPQI